MYRIQALLLAAFITSAHAEVRNIEAPGNLESPSPVECVSVNKLSNNHNPADIFSGINKCMSNKKYSLAAQLYLTAMSYGIYDSKRVSDKTAHQAIIVLRMQSFSKIDKSVISNLQNSINSIIGNNSEYCSSLKQLGKPSYHPKHMIQHGMGAFTGKYKNNEIKSDFQPTKAWSESISSVAKCV